MTFATPATIDPTDIPTVSPADLGKVMEMLIANGQGLVLLKGLDAEQLRDVDEAIWSRLDIAPDRRTAVALRFRCLVAAFAARRLRDLLLSRGFRLIGEAMAAAATQRLNARLGFNTAKLFAALATPQAPSTWSVAPARWEEEQRLAA